MIDCSVRCPRCHKVKPRSEFKQSNIKWYREDNMGVWRIPVCNQCQQEIKAMRIKGKEIIYN